MNKHLIIALCIMLSLNSFSQSKFNGCRLRAGYGNASENYQLLNSSGDYRIDQAVFTDVRVMKSFFSVNPSFFFYYDEDQANAFAHPETEGGGYGDGTVCLGINMIRSEYQYSWSGTTIPIILAHEFGHIVDFSLEATSRSGKECELFADYMAGCYLFYRSIYITTDIQGSIRSFFNKGDYMFTDSGHHGTPQERLNALIAGYNWLRSVSVPGRYISTKNAVDAWNYYYNSVFYKNNQSEYRRTRITESDDESGRRRTRITERDDESGRRRIRDIR